MVAVGMDRMGGKMLFLWRGDGFAVNQADEIVGDLVALYAQGGRFQQAVVLFVLVFAQAG